MISSFKPQTTILALLLCLFSASLSYAQTAEKLLGVWSGKYTEYDGTGNITCNYTLTFTKVEEGYLFGSIECINWSNERESTRGRVQALYQYTDGTSHALFDDHTYVQGSPRKAYGHMDFSQSVQNGRTVLTGKFYPDDETDTANVINVVLYSSAVTGQAAEEPETVAPKVQPSTGSGPQASRQETSDPLQKAADQLLGNAYGKLTSEEKLDILKKTRLRYDEANDKFSYIDKPSLTIRSTRPEVTDFNNDGILEILIKIYGDPNKYLLFIKPNAGASYQLVFNHEGKDPLILGERHDGYCNIYAEENDKGKVYTWNGLKYIFLKNIDKTIVWESRNAISWDSAANYYSNSFRFPDMQHTPFFDRIEPLKDLSGRDPNAKPGSGAKYLGGWWHIGYYKYPIYIKKQGSTYTISDNNFVPKVKSLIYNSRTDQLEGWVSRPGIKARVIVKYDYKSGSITIEPEARELGYGVSLMRYR